MLIQVVGIILVIALLTLPAAIAGQYARSLFQMMVMGTLFGIGFTVCGIWFSYDPELPSSSVIILLAGMAYLFSTIGKDCFRALKRISV